MLAFIRQVFRGFSVAVLAVLLIPATVFVCIVGGFIFLPLPANLPPPNSTLPSEATKIYDINGHQIADVRRFEQNVHVDKNDIPLVLKQAVVASEDKNFYKHHGVDIRGSFRAFWADIHNQKTVQGGSTITQQYVKNAYTNKARTITRKIREAVLASQLDRQISKDEILYRYLSTVYFGDGAYGIGAASENYFRKPVTQLNASESAMLVGLIPAPSAWSPRDNPVENEVHRKIVLDKMLQQHYLTQQQHDDAIAQPLWLESQGPPSGPVTMVYNEQKPQAQFPYFVDYVKRYLTAKFGDQMVYQGGLRVQTTLDPTLQSLAESTVANTLAGTKAPLDMSMVAVEPPTGYVKALVGGRDFQQAQVNLALGGCPDHPAPNVKVLVEPTCWRQKGVVGGGTGRQPGSSFKPVVLATAYSEGVQPGKIYPAPRVYYPPDCNGPTCPVHNFEGESFGPTSIKEAMAHSINTVFAPLVKDVGFVQTANMAKKLGIDSAWYSPTVHGNNGNYALGTIDVSPLEMASAYSVFANRGVRQSATPVVKVLDASGKVLEDNTNREGVRVIDEPVADNVTDALRGVIDHGTGATNGQIGRPAAGKTGTTEDYHDAWFVGYTPTLSTSVWMGYSNSIKTINYKGDTQIAGGTVPTATWASFMREALKDVPPTEFSQPAPIRAPDKNVLSLTPGAPLPIQPADHRSPKPTPTGNYNRVDDSASPYVAAPPTTTTIPPIIPPPAALPAQPQSAPSGAGGQRGR